MRNQRKIWKAEQAALQREKDEYEARREIEREERRMKEQQLAAAKGDKDAIRAINKQQMTFMYAAPPGLEKKNGTDGDEDEAVKAFKRDMVRQDPNFSAAKISKLELAVGRKERKGLTFDELIERHPELKNAPIDGHYAKNVKLNFKPFGKTLSNSRCFRCGEFGHSAGDRICRMTGQAGPHDSARLAMEDPLNYMKHKVKDTRKKEKLPLDGAAGALLASLSKKQQKSLLKALSKQRQQEHGSDSESSSDSSSSSSSSSDDRRRRRKKSSKKHKKANKHKKSKKHKKRSKRKSKSKSSKSSKESAEPPSTAESGSSSRKRKHDSSSKRDERHGARETQGDYADRKKGR